MASFLHAVKGDKGHEHIGVQAHCRWSSVLRHICTFDHITHVSIKHSTSNTFIGTTKLYLVRNEELVILGQWPCVSIMWKGTKAITLQMWRHTKANVWVFCSSSDSSSCGRDVLQPKVGSGKRNGGSTWRKSVRHVNVGIMSRLLPLCILMWTLPKS